MRSCQSSCRCMWLLHLFFAAQTSASVHPPQTCKLGSGGWLPRVSTASSTCLKVQKIRVPFVVLPCFHARLSCRRAGIGAGAKASRRGSRGPRPRRLCRSRFLVHHDDDTAALQAPRCARPVGAVRRELARLAARDGSVCPP